MKSFSQAPVEEFGQPERIAVIWKDSVLQGVGDKPTKGFGGRVFLYDSENKPIKAEGELIVYGYEDGSDTSSAADRKYVFKQDKFQSHYDKTQLGDSYSVWLPWEKIGGYRKQVILIPMFRTANGRIIQDQQSIAVLPGKKMETSDLVKTDIPNRLYDSQKTVRQVSNNGNDKSRVALASGDASANRINNASGTEARQLRTTTLTVPRDLGNRLAQLPPQTAKTKTTVNRQERMTRDLNEVMNRVRTSHAVKQANVDPELNLRKRLSGKVKSKDPSDFNGGNAATPIARKPVFGQPGSFR